MPLTFCDLFPYTDFYLCSRYKCLTLLRQNSPDFKWSSYLHGLIRSWVVLVRSGYDFISKRAEFETRTPWWADRLPPYSIHCSNSCAATWQNQTKLTFFINVSTIDQPGHKFSLIWVMENHNTWQASLSVHFRSKACIRLDICSLRFEVYLDKPLNSNFLNVLVFLNLSWLWFFYQFNSCHAEYFKCTTLLPKFLMLTYKIPVESMLFIQSGK